MPLRDHFHPPLSVDRPWEAFHSAWAVAISEQLNESLLPVGFVALPLVSHGPVVEIDVATVRERVTVSAGPAIWQPEQPAQSLSIDWSKRDLFEIRILQEGKRPRLVAAIELVSPGNKDRPTSRRTFAGKCAGYLRQGVGTVVVDVVTERHDSLHRELIDLLELNESQNFDAELYAVSYRTTTPDTDTRLELWPNALALGQPLPALPLWIADDLPIRLDLETSYETTCRRLRMS
jgi:hypothetical protein